MKEYVIALVSGKYFTAHKKYFVIDGSFESGVREKSKAEAAKFDNTEKLTEYTNRIDNLKAIMIRSLNGKSPNYSAISEISQKIDWNEGYMKRLKDNDFKSVSEIERTLEYIDKYISEAENVSL